MAIGRQKRLERAQLRVLFQVPFFAPAVARLPVEFDNSPDNPTACTNGKRIRWNGAFFDKLSDDELVTVLCHECCHPLLGHLWRAPAGADHEGWNEACDHAVNLMLEEFGALVQAKNLANPFPFPPGAWFKDPQFSGMAEEVIYSKLLKSGGGGGGGGGGGAGGKGKGKPTPGRQPFGEFEIEKSDPDTKKDKTSWDQTLVQCSAIGKGRGELPAGMSRFVKDLLESKVPWYEVVRHWLREKAADDYNWMKPNRMYSGGEFILPVLESETLGPIVFATDTSGSIDADMLAQFQTEKQSCLDDMKPSRLVDIYCDAKIHKVAEYRQGDKIDTDAPGGGGTDFRPVFEHAGKLDQQPRCLVYLTDLDGTFPKADPGFPVLWVTWTEGGTAPFGEVVYAG